MESFALVSGKLEFHLRRRTQDMPKRKKKKGRGPEDMDEMGGYPFDAAQLPYLTELNPGELDGLSGCLFSQRK